MLSHLNRPQMTNQNQYTAVCVCVYHNSRIYKVHNIYRIFTLFFQGSGSFPPMPCVRLIQLVRTERNKPIVIYTWCRKA